MLPHPLTNFEIQKYYQNELRFNSVYSFNNLPNKLMDAAYVINLDEYADFGTYWIAFCAVKQIPKALKKLIGNKTVTTNICRTQACNSIMCECIDFMLNGKSLTDFTNLFSPDKFKAYDKIILISIKDW